MRDPIERSIAAAALAAAMLLAACATPDAARDDAPPAPQGPAAAPAEDAQAAAVAPAEEFPARDGAPLELEEALRMALACSPDAEAARARISGARARGAAAGSWSEPTVYAGVEALPFSSPREEEEWLVGLTFALPAPGAGAAERSVAEAERSLAELALERTLRAVDAELRAAFGAALAAQQATALAAEVMDLRMQMRATLSREWRAGLVAEDVPLAAQLEELRAASELRVAHELEGAARRRLDLLLPPPAHGRPLGGVLDEALALPELAALLERVAELPQAAEAAADARLAELRAELADARRIPEVAIDLAWRERSDGRASLDAVVGVGLPFGGRRAAEAEGARLGAAASAAAARQRWREVRGELLDAHAAANAATERLRLLDSGLLPLQSRRVALAESGFAAGDLARAGLLEVRLDYVALKVEALETRAALHRSWARLRPFLLVAE